MLHTLHLLHSGEKPPTMLHASSCSHLSFAIIGYIDNISLWLDSEHPEQNSSLFVRFSALLITIHNLGNFLEYTLGFWEFKKRPPLPKYEMTLRNLEINFLGKILN